MWISEALRKARQRRQNVAKSPSKTAKAGWLQERELSRSSDSVVTGALVQYLYQGRTFAWDADLDEKVLGLTPEQIAAALRRHIDPNKISIVKAGDFEKK